ncbi:MULTISPECIES: O-antigen ligase family protein [unclassified Microbacterium]|uniref:O-antigen ligase family protein n=1 Tax=unclassified Microbacterium TaxID=2609290 RepID=UPI0021A3792E|nr:MULTISPECIES: O-antigen ligase family protein [unclassified Microbacterium]MCT1364505.1 O-antigen ligase family protein [Microbacterium sp. p3-SID131]MCT1376410.1 O-antigen ligase family protein [Microbacterium sp. p3-SID337]
MAQYTKHPVAALPTAPERESTGHLLLRGYVIAVLFVAFAHSAVYNLLGEIGAAIVLALFSAATLAIGVPMLARNRPQPFRWRRLPWAAVGYTALALLSVAWSQWRVPTVATGMLLAAVTVNGLFIAHVLTWHEIVRALSSAFKWVLGLSLALELWVSLVLHGPLLPNFADIPAGKIDPQWYWVRDNLFDGGRIQGILGNANLLGIVSLFALITFGVLFAARARWRTTLALWMILAAYFLFRTASATALACAGAAAVVLVVALLMRRAASPTARTRIYVVAIGSTAVLALAVWLLREPLLGLLGRSADLTGRSNKIWAAVLERVGEHPVIGNGFSSPWVPTDPAFDGWIVDHGITVFHAHNMWLDVLLQLGVLGLVLMAVAYGSLLWRSWFFAVDRPRWDLDAHRPYSPLTLLPSLYTVVLLVQGLTESTPIMLWGWLLLVLLSFKLKSVPLVGVGERDLVFERGTATRRVP